MMEYVRQETVRGHPISSTENPLDQATLHGFFAIPTRPMKQTRAQERGLRMVADVAGWFLIALGATVATAWLSRSSSPELLVPDIFQQKFNTALALIVAGVGVIATLKDSKRVALAAGALLFTVAAATLLEYATGVDLGIDQILLRDFHFSGSPYPGRMSPGTALLLLTAGVWQVLTATDDADRPRHTGWAELLSFLVFAFGAAGLAGHLIGAAQAYTWGSYAVMSYPTAAGFIALGMGLMALTWLKRDARVATIPLWVPAALCLLVLVLDIATPLGVAVGIAYVPLVFCSVWFNRPQSALVFATVGTLLTIFGLLVSPLSEIASWVVLANRALSIGALWLTAVLVFQHRKAEESARRSDEKARALANIVESSNDAITSKALDGTVLTFNTGAERLFGYSAADLIGQNAAIGIPDSLMSEEDAIIERLIQGKAVEPYETVRLRKDGTPIDVSLTISPLRDADGQIIGISKIARDISARKWAEERFRMVVEAAPTAIVAVDEIGNIVLVNAQTEALFGYSRDDLLQLKLEALVPERVRGKHPRHRAAFFANPRARSMGAGRDLYALRKDGSEFPVEIGLSPMKTGQNLLVLSTIVDISARKQHEDALRSSNEALERSNIELQRFAYVASHDLQTPMRSISNFVGLLRSTYADKLDAQANDWIRRTEQSIGYLQTLTRELLNYSLVDTQASPFQRVSMRGVFDNAVQLLDASAQESGAEISCGELPTINGDRPQLVQLVQNLIGNALKYRAKDVSPHVHLSAEQRNDEWIFALRDNGIGIAPKHQERIFEIFKRLHDQSEYPGTGIGLAVCRRVVHRHGGRMWVESEPGSGSVFYFSIPKGSLDE